MNKRNKFLEFLLIAIIALIAGRVAYRWAMGDDIELSPQESELADAKLQKLLEEIEPFDRKKTHFYDFYKMVALVDACGVLRRQFKADFEKSSSDVNIDREFVVNLLKRLLNERIKLREYIWDLKGFSRSGIPIKKYRSLLYYLEVLDNNIADMREILHEDIREEKKVA